LKYFPLDEQKCPGTAYGRLGNLTMYLIREFEVRLISQTGLTVQSMQVSLYISYFVNIMNAGCRLCVLLRICQDITRLESAEANWRTEDPEEAGDL
jgi:hypothetical protein